MDLREFVAENNLVGRDIEIPDTTRYLRGPISKVYERSDRIVIKVAWWARCLPDGSWERWPYGTGECPIYQWRGLDWIDPTGGVHFRLDASHSAVFRPKGEKLMSVDVKGLTEEEIVAEAVIPSDEGSVQNAASS